MCSHLICTLKIKEVRFGVNEESILGPLLSIIFINEIESNQENTKSIRRRDCY